MSAFVVSSIASSLKIDANQRFILGAEIAPEPLGAFKLDNIYVPVLGTPSITNFETRNNTLSGFRWVHTTSSTNTFGQLKLQSFVNAQSTGIDLISFNQDGTISFIAPVSFNLPNLVNVIGGTQTFQFNFATASFTVGNTIGNSVNEFRANYGGSIGGIRLGVSGDAPINKFGYINLVGGAPLYFQVDSITKMYMNGQGSFVVGTSPVGFPYAKFDVHGGELNVFNEESVIRATSSSLSSKIEINNTAANGRLYELRSNSDGSFNIFDRTSNISRFKISTEGNIEFDLSYTSVTNPSPYQLLNTLNDSQISKNFKYRVLTNTITNREWNHDYTLIGNSDLNGIYQLNYKVAASTYTPLSIVIFPFAPSQTLMSITVPVDMGGFEIKNALNPTTAQSLTTKNYVDTAISNHGIILTGAVTGSGASSFATTLASSQTVTGTTQTFNYSNALSSSIFSLVNTNASAITSFKAGTSFDYVQLGYDGSNGYSFINLASSSNDRLAFRVNGTGIAALLSSGLFGLGTITPTLGKLQINGGVQNIANEETAIHVRSALNNVKIELQCTSGTGKLYEIRSSNNGNFDITNRTNNITVYSIDSNSNHIFNTTGTLFAKRPRGYLHMSNNVVGTVTTAGTWVKVAGTTILGTTSNLFDMPVNNRIRHIGSIAIPNVNINVCITFGYGSSISTKLGFSLFKNGSLITESPKFVTNTTTNLSMFVGLAVSTALTTNDYIEIFCTSPTAGISLTCTDMSIIIG